MKTSERWTPDPNYDDSQERYDLWNDALDMLGRMPEGPAKERQAEICQLLQVPKRDCECGCGRKQYPHLMVYDDKDRLVMQSCVILNDLFESLSILKP